MHLAALDGDVVATTRSAGATALSDIHPTTAIDVFLDAGEPDAAADVPRTHHDSLSRTNDRRESARGLAVVDLGAGLRAGSIATKSGFTRSEHRDRTLGEPTQIRHYVGNQALDIRGRWSDVVGDHRCVSGSFQTAVSLTVTLKRTNSWLCKPSARGDAEPSGVPSTSATLCRMVSCPAPVLATA